MRKRALRYTDVLSSVTNKKEARRVCRAAHRRTRKYSREEIHEAFKLVMMGMPTEAMLEIVEDWCLGIRTNPD
jgi:hypothetical protein